VEILTRHAARCLELLTVARAHGLHPQPAHDAPAAAGLEPSTNGPAKSGVGVEPPPSSEPPQAAEPPAEPAARPEHAPQVSEEDASALRYARLLISEIKLYNEDAVNEGRRDGNLQERLGPEIARARRLYEERIPSEVRSRADHFGQELVRTLANGDPRLLGQAT
jgi:hypothetical protein